MWQSPNQRVRAIAAARQRERDRLKQPFHVRRVLAELKVISPTEIISITARVILNDIGPKGMGLFTTHSLVSGQEVVLTLREPKPLEVRGIVVACQQFDNGSHILSVNNFSYRLGLRFSFQSPEEEKAIQSYYEELIKDYLHGSKAA